jgi:hypothetical protein
VFHDQLPFNEPMSSCPDPAPFDDPTEITQSAVSVLAGWPQATPLTLCTQFGIWLDCTQLSGVEVRSPVQTAAVDPELGDGVPVARQVVPRHDIPVTAVAPVGKVGSAAHVLAPLPAMVASAMVPSAGLEASPTAVATHWVVDGQVMVPTDVNE